MKNAMQRLKKHNKKGFTLVELLVVLVILAILAAAIIPSMRGFIDRAKKESVAAEQRSVLLAAQVEVNELYGKGTLDTLLSSGSSSVKIDSTDKTKDYLAAIQTVADLPGTILSVTVTKDTPAAGSTEPAHWTITGAEYVNKENNMKYTYEAKIDTTTQKYAGSWGDGAKYTPPAGN